MSRRSSTHRATVPVDEIQFPNRVTEFSLMSAEDPIDSASVVIPNSDVPTQVANPRRTTLRAAVQIAVALVTVAPVIALVITQTVGEGWLYAAALQVLAVHTAVVRIMATPGVDQYIRTNLPWLYPIPLQEIPALPNVDGVPQDDGEDQGAH